jgi:hypothetical protein
MFKMSTCGVGLLLAGLVGLGCGGQPGLSSGGDGAGGGGGASGGQAGSTISITTGGSSGTIDAGGVGRGSIGGAGSGTVMSSGGSAACDHYFDAQYLRCGGPVLPAAEVSRIRSRFQQVCTNEFALPGSGVTEASLEACASAMAASACQLPAGPPIACDFRGTLSGGAACTDNVQCASGQCQGTQTFSPEGPTAPVTCGTCVPAVAVGQVCGQGNFSAGCPQGAGCMTTDTTAMYPTYSCVVMTQGDDQECASGFGCVPTGPCASNVLSRSCALRGRTLRAKYPLRCGRLATFHSFGTRGNSRSDPGATRPG